MASFMPFGYWKIDPTSQVARPKKNGITVPATAPRAIQSMDYTKNDWLLLNRTPCLNLEWNLMDFVGGGGTIQ